MMQGLRLSALVLLISLGSPTLGLTAAKQVFIYNNTILPSALDPAVVSDFNGRNIFMQLFEGLTSYNPSDLSPQPGVAKRWTISKDGRIYTFFLNPKALWSDGSRVTADDFVFAWQRVLDPKTKAPLAFNLFMIKNSRAYNHGDLKDPSQLGMRAISPEVLEVTLEAPVPYFLQLTSFFTLFPVPKKHVLQNTKNWADPKKIISNGPFIYDSRPEAQLMVLKKNPQYWDQERVRLQELRIYAIQDPVQVMSLYREGKLDYTGETPIPFQEIPKWRYTTDYHSTPWFALNFLRFNTQKAPFDKVDVRKAIALAIDKEKIVRYVNPGDHLVANSVVPLGVDGYRPPEMDKYNPKMARELLAKAGYCLPESTDKGSSHTKSCEKFPAFTLLVDNNDAAKKLVLTIQQMLKKELGIDSMQIQVIEDFQQYLEKRRKMDFHIARSRWVGDYFDPNTFMALWTSDNINNNTGWKNNKFDTLIRLAGEETNRKRRYAFFDQAEELLLQEMPVAPIYNFSQTYLLKPYVRNYRDNLQRALILKDVYIEHYQLKNR